MTSLSPTPEADLTYETNLSIRAHYASGRFDLDTALDRIQFGGPTILRRDVAAEILRQPISLNDVRRLAGRSGQTATEASIAARLAEVTA
jgi:hypothetical protein